MLIMINMFWAYNSRMLINLINFFWTDEIGKPSGEFPSPQANAITGGK
jgi:hypothetical protein